MRAHRHRRQDGREAGADAKAVQGQSRQRRSVQVVSWIGAVVKEQRAKCIVIRRWRRVAGASVLPDLTRRPGGLPCEYALAQGMPGRRKSRISDPNEADHHQIEG